MPAACVSFWIRICIWSVSQSSSQRVGMKRSSRTRSGISSAGMTSLAAKAAEKNGPAMKRRVQPSSSSGQHDENARAFGVAFVLVVAEDRHGGKGGLLALLHKNHGFVEAQAAIVFARARVLGLSPAWRSR